MSSVPHKMWVLLSMEKFSHHTREAMGLENRTDSHLIWDPLIFLKKNLANLSIFSPTYLNIFLIYKEAASHITTNCNGQHKKVEA